MQTCTVTGGTYGTDLCTDDCTGYYSTDIGDGYKYRYYILGDYHNATDVDSCVTPTDPLPGAEYYPFTPVCMKGYVACPRLPPTANTLMLRLTLTLALALTLNRSHSSPPPRSP